MDEDRTTKKVFNALPIGIRRKATRGFLATEHVILNHGQVTWTTPELTPPSPSNHTNGRTFELSTGLTYIAALHECPENWEKSSHLCHRLPTPAIEHLFRKDLFRLIIILFFRMTVIHPTVEAHLCSNDCNDL
ncbi:hypothetical protein TNCV_1676641 [Trichonephila clavipes]|nr:hypothetical protein TNCV_1676641 [Trichonephila clavipes]